MQGFASDFLHRLWFAHHIGAVRKIGGKYVSLPLYHRRPPAPFEKRLTRCDKIELNHWYKNIKVIDPK